MLRFLFVLFGIVVLSYACILKKPEKVNQEFVELSIENFKLQDPIENCLSNIKVLPLETDTNCLMGYIEKIEICEPYILVLDVNHTLFVYLMDGSFVYKVAATGRGPKDITRLGGFYVDKLKKHVVVWDNMKQKMFHYDFKGDLLSIVKCDNEIFYAAKDMKMIEKDKLLLSLAYHPGITSSFVSMSCSAYSFDRAYFTYPYRWKTRSSGYGNPTQAHNTSGNYVINMFSDTVYHYQNDSFIPRFVLKSSETSIFKSNFDHFTDYGDMISYALNNHLSQGLLGIVMTDSVCNTQYRYKNRWNQVYWNIYTRRGVYTPNTEYSQNVLKNINFKTATGQDFVGFVLPHQLNIKIISETCSPEVVAKLASLSEDDNPILVFYPIKI